MASGRPLNVEQLVSTVGRSARGAHQSKLPEASVAALRGFAEWLVNVEKKSPNTASAYKSWAAKAMVERGAHDPHVLSAVKALARYQASKRGS